ncbi:MAG TPA: hypothetical protein VI643_04975, partial [Planctomycetota bacterium]|nr:hypothetical protein [Planctomycetota bacterium]
YETLVDIAAGPYEREKADWSARARECEREHEATVNLQQLQKLEAEQKWPMLAGHLLKYHERYTGTRTHREGQPLLKALANRAGPEAEVEIELYEAETLFASKRWKELAEAISRLKRHLSTDAWRRRESDIREWEVRSLTEPPAETLYKEITTHKAKGEWGEVRDKLVILRSQHAASLFVKENAAVLDGIEADAATALSGKFEEDAKIRWQDADDYYKRKKYREAQVALADLLEGPYRGTQFVKDSNKKIRDLKESVDKTLGSEEAKDLHAKLRSATNSKNWTEAYEVGRELWTRYLSSPHLSDARKREVRTWFDEAVGGVTRLDMNGSIEEWKRHDLSVGGKPGELSQLHFNAAEPSDKYLRLVGGSASGSIFCIPVKLIPPEAQFLMARISADKPDVKVLLGVKDQESLSSLSGFYSSNPVAAMGGGLQPVQLKLSEFKVPASGIKTGESKPFGYVGIFVPAGATVFVDNIEFRVPK